MNRAKMTTRELLDFAATPKNVDEYDAVEASRFLTAGGRVTHLFCFHGETPARKRRWFDHCVESCDAWERVSERRLLADYGDATWWVVTES